ncbi:MAG: type II secretion system protein M [Pseudomonadota bacterium]
MSSYFDNFRSTGVGQWFYGREVSEQRIIAALAILVVATALWLGIWQPVSEWRSAAVERQQRVQQLADWLRANESAAKQAARRNTNANVSRTPTPVITRTAQLHEITINRLQPEANGVVSVVLERQSFNKIIAWINQLETGNDITVERASVDGLENPGYVNAQLRLN